jgi:hypothetical protein
MMLLYREPRRKIYNSTAKLRSLRLDSFQSLVNLKELYVHGANCIRPCWKMPARFVDSELHCRSEVWEQAVPSCLPHSV